MASKKKKGESASPTVEHKIQVWGALPYARKIREDGWEEVLKATADQLVTSDDWDRDFWGGCLVLEDKPIRLYVSPVGRADSSQAQYVISLYREYYGYEREVVSAEWKDIESEIFDSTEEAMRVGFARLQAISAGANRILDKMPNKNIKA